MINYEDLYKVYHGHLSPIVKKTEPPPPPPPPEPEPTIIYVVEEREPKEPQEIYIHTEYHDPLRDLASAAVPYAMTYGIANLLGFFGESKNYVGNQHISSMSDERVAEYRRLGLLPPPS